MISPFAVRLASYSFPVGILKSLGMVIMTESPYFRVLTTIAEYPFSKKTITWNYSNYKKVANKGQRPKNS
ncbi:hypothetical protein JCM5176_12450 [Streptococcus sobrinus]|nr:Uncharacterised protein [Streptococcus sobrinus]